MTNSDKAKRTPVGIDTPQVEGFQMPNGTYLMSEPQAAECLGKPEINA
ncbi:MAG: hypothetical protein ICV77_17710, partial [Cyanobacteria bacterium Co-bin8]|nr:hypothetical protein [Cyanobacteria bacterium Co-bin8]